MDRQQERNGGKIPSKRRSERFATLKTMPSAAGGQWSFCRRSVTWSWRVHFLLFLFNLIYLFYAEGQSGSSAFAALGII